MSRDRYVNRGGVLVPKALGYDVVAPWNLYKRRMAGYSTYAFPVDEDHQVGSWDLTRLRLESRNAYRNHPLARAIVDSICNAAVGTTSLTPLPRTSSNDWNDAAYEFFTEWGKVADYRGRSRSMAEMDWLCCQHMLLDGEMFYVLMPETGQLLPIEAECIVTPAGRTSDPLCLNGAEISRFDEHRVYGWWVAKRNEYGNVDNTRCDFVDARDMLHVRCSDRSDSIRGIPKLAPVLATMIDYKEYREALRLKVKHEAKRSFNIVSDSEEGPGNLGNRMAGYATQDTTDTPAQKGVTFEQVGDLEIWHTRPDERLDSMEMKNPGQYHVQFSESEAQEICGAVGVSWEWVRKIFSTSYIAGQASILATQPTIERYQEAIESHKKRREWNWRIAKAMKDGDLPSAPTYKRGTVNVSEWFRCEWNWPPMITLDRAKDANADSQEWRNATTSLTEQNRRKGGTFDHTLEMRTKEARKILTAAGYPPSTPIPLWMIGPTPQNIPPESMTPPADDQAGEPAARKTGATK